MHNIEYYTYEESVNKNTVQTELDQYVSREDYQEGCRGLYRKIRWIDKPVYANREEAEDALKSLDKHDYDQLAVRYFEAMPLADKKTKELEKQVSDAYAEYRKRNDKVYPHTLSSAFIGCKECGSRISVAHLHSNRCPVCCHDLRPEYVLKSIKAAEKKWNGARAKLAGYIDKHAKKQVYWLVKIEYHT